VQHEPDVELWANVLGSSILIGLRVPPPRDRARSQPEPGAMPMSVASALVLLTDPQDSDHFLDPFFDGGAVVSARSAHPARLLLGGAVDPRRMHAQTFPVGSSLPLLTCWDVARLPLPAAALDKVATRFPYLPASTVMAHYVPWLRELQRVLQSGAQAAILTRSFESFKDAIRQAPALEIRGGYSVTIAGEWGRIYLLQRS
jgi:tRNA G10  N-methylase Trm11